ncbi:MAG: hypothetical protein IAF08_12890 [Rhizobacter sp.]|nr:hypothetical protein [Chlorobiales bacterium]
MNLAGKWREDSVVYLAANVLGSALSAYASYMIAYLPFVVLELTWCAVSAIKLTTVFRKS